MTTSGSNVARTGAMDEDSSQITQSHHDLVRCRCASGRGLPQRSHHVHNGSGFRYSNAPFEFEQAF